MAPHPRIALHRYRHSQGRREEHDIDGKTPTIETFDEIELRRYDSAVENITSCVLCRQTNQQFVVLTHRASWTKLCVHLLYCTHCWTAIHQLPHLQSGT